MSERRYTEDHEWIDLDGEIGTVGITDFAQEQLGEVVFVEVPDVGKTVAQGDETAVVESVKAASELYAPVTGEVVEAQCRAGRHAGSGEQRSRRRSLVLQDQDFRQGRIRRPDGRRRLQGARGSLRPGVVLAPHRRDDVRPAGRKEQKR